MNRKGVRIIVILILFISVVIAFFFSPLFNIKEIEIMPMEYYDEKEVYVHLAGLIGKNGFSEILKHKSLSQSESILSFQLDELEDKLVFECPYLRDVSISYRFPNKVVVNTKERIPIFLLKERSVYLYIDSEGYLLSTFTEEDEKPNLPIVQGIELDNYKVGQPITKSEDKRIDTAIKLCNLLKQLSIHEDRIDIIDVSDPDNIWFYTHPSLSVKFGDMKEPGLKLSYLKEIFNAGFDGESNGVIDFSSGGYPVFRHNE